jgi:hypothetical protein
LLLITSNIIAKIKIMKINIIPTTFYCPTINYERERINLILIKNNNIPRIINKILVMPNL